MSDNYDYLSVKGTGARNGELSAPKYDRKEEPMPSREELLARKSFGSPDDNKYLNRSKKK